jgi:hypothetical protein
VAEELPDRISIISASELRPSQLLASAGIGGPEVQDFIV